MKRVGQVATYPARMANLPRMLQSIVGQLDEVHVVLNEYSHRQRRELPAYGNVSYVIPKADLKDTGKFMRPANADELIFLMDDDLVFPPDYTARLIDFYRRAPSQRIAVGLHGVVYSDLFEGAPSSRFVAKFDKALAQPMLVNQLGTGCLMIRGDLMPSFAYMQSSQQFVDVRFARYCHEAGIARICISRAAGWVIDQAPESSIFETFTRLRHAEQLGEVLAFGGFGKLDTKLALAVERL